MRVDLDLVSAVRSVLGDDEIDALKGLLERYHVVDSITSAPPTPNTVRATFISRISATSSMSHFHHRTWGSSASLCGLLRDDGPGRRLEQFHHQAIAALALVRPASRLPSPRARDLRLRALDLRRG